MFFYVSFDVLIVGFGKMGSLHFNALKRLYDLGYVRKIYIVEPIFEKLRGVENSVDGVFRDVNDVNINFDFAIIATPTRTHFEIANKLIHKADLLIEKPVCDEFNKVIELHNLSKKLGRKIFVGMIERFNPVIQYLKRVDVTDVKYLKCIRFTECPKNIETYVNVLLDLSIHDIDILTYLLNVYEIDFNKVKIKYAYYVDDLIIKHIHCILDFYDLCFEFISSWLFNFKHRFLEIICDKSAYLCDLYNYSVYFNNSIINFDRVDQVFEEDKHVINVLRGVEKPIIDLEYAIPSHAIINYIFKNLTKR